MNGSYGEVEKMLTEKMQKAAADMEFEKAAEYRDLLGSVRACVQKQKITNASEMDDKDIVALAKQGEDAVVQVFFVRSGKPIGREHFFMNVRMDEADREVVTRFIQQFYAGTPIIPREIFLQEEIEDARGDRAMADGEKRTACLLACTAKGMKNKMVELAEKNAAMVLAQDRERIKKEEGRTIGALKRDRRTAWHGASKPHGSLRYFQYQRLSDGWLHGGFSKRENLCAVIIESSNSRLSRDRMTMAPCGKF